MDRTRIGTSGGSLVPCSNGCERSVDAKLASGCSSCRGQSMPESHASSGVQAVEYTSRSI